MRYGVLMLAVALWALAGCKKEDDKKTKAPPAPAPTIVANPKPMPTTRGPTRDLQDIQGKWETGGKDAPVQLEFAGDMLTMRSGPGPAWKQTGRYRFALKDRIIPPQIDWGEGPDAAHGLYTIDGSTLIITYTTGSEPRPAKLELKKPPVTQLWLNRAK